jgi:hypothetical protein
MGGKTWSAIAGLWVSYSLMYWGWVLLRGYNITFLEVVAPVNYWQGGPLKNAGTVPSGQVYPSASSS